MKTKIFFYDKIVMIAFFLLIIDLEKWIIFTFIYLNLNIKNNTFVYFNKTILFNTYFKMYPAMKFYHHGLEKNFLFSLLTKLYKHYKLRLNRT